MKETRKLGVPAGAVGLEATVSRCWRTQRSLLPLLSETATESLNLFRSIEINSYRRSKCSKSFDAVAYSRTLYQRCRRPHKILAIVLPR